MKVKGFWHIWMTSHWYTVITDQMRILLTSGLYDECDEISIGCIGTEEEKHLLEMYFINIYPKLKIKYYSNNASDFEFPTLRLIVDDDTPYAAFYFHTKGVTRPHETVINHWRSCMNESILNQWRWHYQNILDGYDASSVNFMQSPDHFSGNFWWASRHYISRCQPIETLNLTYRFHAEQWICTGKGKFAFPPFKEPGDNCFKIQYKI